MYAIVFSEDAKKDLKILYKKAPQAISKLSKKYFRSKNCHKRHTMNMKSENEAQLEKRMLAGSPIAYFISDEGHEEWVLFLHAAFVTHEMFRMQFGYFRDKYNI